ncbi:MAG: ABC transporter permease [Chloroflexi bacterium]|nr:ABC transporter permease [Chloroflexota bacterium]
MTAPVTVKPTPIIQHIAWTISDTIAVTKRNLITYVRLPQLLVFSSIQPVIFVLMFRYVFGGAISVPGGSYVDFLMPGIFVQTVVFGAMNTAVGLAEDLRKGLLERFRSLPMSRAAVLAGRTLAEFVRNIWVVALMCGVGFAVGFRVHTDPWVFVSGLALLLLFGFALTWVFAFVGLSTGNAETAQAASFPVMAVLVFASSAFVPTESMPGWLQGWTNNQPVSVTLDAVRALSIGGPTASKVLTSVAWCFGILVVAVPIAIWRYRTKV